MRTPTNAQVAAALERVAELLDAQRASRFRVQAFRNAASSVRAMTRPVAEALDTVGTEGLERLPGIGKTLAEAIRQLVRTGRYGMLERLDDEVSPEEVLRTIPGLGPKMARRLHDELGVSTLEGLEVALRDGRLERLKGFGPRRLRLVREVLAARRTCGPGTVEESEQGEPSTAAAPVALLLAVDAEYRVDEAQGRLSAPSSFAAPQLCVVRDGWRFTAHYSRTERARTLHRDRDWVVITAEPVDPAETGVSAGALERCTVVTEHRGVLTGRRVVRGRERECLDFYGAHTEVRIDDAASEETPGTEDGQEELFPAGGWMN